MNASQCSTNFNESSKVYDDFCCYVNDSILQYLHLNECKVNYIIENKYIFQDTVGRKAEKIYGAHFARNTFRNVNMCSILQRHMDFPYIFKVSEALSIKMYLPSNKKNYFNIHRANICVTLFNPLVLFSF